MPARDVPGVAVQPGRASVVVVCTNELHHLRDCLPALARQSYPDYEVLLVDNGSTDGGPEYAEAAFPTVRVLRNRANLGYVGANNRGFAEATGEYLAVLNPDTAVEPNWLEKLVQELRDHPEAGLATSRICYFDDRQRINTCGNDIHLTGLAFCRGLDRPRQAYARSERVPAISGCAFAIRRDVLDEIQGFDPDFFIYFEDADLSLRANLAGYQIRLAADSIVYHKYALRLRPQKFFLMERNRVVLLLKNLRWRTVAALLPALLLMEAMTWSYALTSGGGYVGAKLRAYAWLAGHWRQVLARRAAVQRLRRTSDAELLGLLSARVPMEQIVGAGPVGRALAAFASGVFGWSLRAALATAS